MSDTNVQNVDQNALADLFPDLGAINPAKGGNPKFGMSEDVADIFKTTPNQQSDPAAEAAAIAASY